MSHPPHITAANLSELPHVRHGFFGRAGGVSTGVYDSLNLGMGSGDDARNIRENRTRVKQCLDAEHLLSCFQIHGADVVQLSGAWQSRPRADAMVTSQPGLALCILTADCVPVLFANANTGIIGAAHAGWKGALNGVIEATLVAMQNLGAPPETTHVAIGPAIQQASYEVGSEFRDTWLEAHEWTETLFAPGTADRFHFDLVGFVKTTLKRAGIIHIQDMARDTCAEEDAYFSNRRRNQRGLGDYGRNGSVIMLA